MAKRTRSSRNRQNSKAKPPLAADETRVIFARHPAVLLEQVYAMTAQLPEATHQLTIITDLPGGLGEWVAAILSPMVTDGD